MARFNTDTMEALMQPVMDYAKELNNADRIRLASQLLGYVNAAQQYADIDADAMWHAKEETNLFNHVEADDPMDPGYHLHNMLDNMADEFETLADIVAECDTEAA